MKIRSMRHLVTEMVKAMDAGVVCVKAFQDFKDNKGMVKIKRDEFEKIWDEVALDMEKPLKRAIFELGIVEIECIEALIERLERIEPYDPVDIRKHASAHTALVNHTEDFQAAVNAIPMAVSLVSDPELADKVKECWPTLFPPDVEDTAETSEEG